MEGNSSTLCAGESVTVLIQEVLLISLAAAVHACIGAALDVRA